MKIIHFHTDVRMADIFVRPLILAERDCGHESHLYCAGPLTAHGSSIVPYDLAPVNLIRAIFSLPRIMSIMRGKRPDIVFSHNTRSAFLPLLCAFLARVPVRVYFNHGVPYIAYRGPTRWALHVLEHLNLAFSTRVVTVSRDMVSLLQDMNPKAKVDLIDVGSACGIDISVFNPRRYDHAKWRSSLGIKNEELVVVFIGRPERRKGFSVLLSLWASNFQTSNARLVLVGPDMGDVQKYLSSVPTNIIALGFVNNVAEVLASSDVLIHPSLHEGFSYACLEAQASKLLVLANDIVGIRSLVTNGVTGFLIKDNNPSTYTDFIEQAIIDREKFSQIRLDGYSSARKFSRSLFLNSYIKFLEGSLLSHSRGWKEGGPIAFAATTPFAVNAFLMCHMIALSRNWPVVLFTNCGAYDLEVDLPKEITVVHVPFQRNISICSDISSFLRLLFILRRLRPMSIHSITPKAGIFAMLAGYLSGVPNRWHTFTGQVWVTRRGLARNLLKMIDGRVARLATQVFADSASQCRFLVEEGVVGNGHISMLGSGSMSGVDLERAQHAMADRSILRGQLGISPNACVFLFVGRVSRDKGISDLIRAFDGLAKVLKNIELLIVGPDEGGISQSLEELASRCDAPVRKVGSTKCPEHFMAASDVLVLPSYREGFGSVIIEAAACGLPTIAYRIDGVVDAVIDGDGGILVEPGNLVTLASAMAILATDKELRCRLGDQARRRANSEFSRETLTSVWMSFYEERLSAE